MAEACSRIARARPFFQLRFSVWSGEHVRRYGRSAFMDHKAESLRQQRLQHQPKRFFRCGRRRFGLDVEAIPVQPARPGLHMVGIKAISGGV